MKNLSISLAIFLGFSVNALAQDCSHGRRTEEVGRLPSTFVINYKDGSKENIVIRYVGDAALNVSQTGSASTWNHPIDNRRCSWSTEASVTRQLCIVSKTLGEQCEGNYTKVFYVTGAGAGDVFNPFKLDFQGENCNSACGRFNADFNNAKTAVTESLNGVYEQDFKPFLEQIKQKSEIANIGSE